MSTKHFKFQEIVSVPDQKLVFGYIREQYSIMEVPICLKQICALYFVDIEEWNEKFTNSNIEIYGSNNDLIITVCGGSLNCSCGSIVAFRGRHHWKFKIIRLKDHLDGKSLSMGVSEEETLATKAKRRGNKHCYHGRYNEAIDEYTKAIQLNDTEHTYYSNRSACYAVTNQLDKALVDGRKCIALKPDWAKGYGRVGYALFKLGKIAEAKAAYKAGLKIDPNNKNLTDGVKQCKNAMDKACPTFIELPVLSKSPHISVFRTHSVSVNDVIINAHVTELSIPEGTIVDMMLDLQSDRKRLIISYKSNHKPMILTKDVSSRAYRMTISMPEHGTCVKLLSYRNDYDPTDFLLSSISM